MLEGRSSFGAVAIGPAVEQDIFDALIAKVITHEVRDARAFHRGAKVVEYSVPFLARSWRYARSWTSKQQHRSH
jgi:hypothetical protein